MPEGRRAVPALPLLTTSTSHLQPHQGTGLGAHLAHEALAAGQALQMGRKPAAGGRAISGDRRAGQGRELGLASQERCL